MDKKLNTHEMNTCEKSVPLLIFGNGEQKSMNIAYEQESDGIALLISKVSEGYQIDNNGLSFNKINKPYFMLYFKDALFIDQMISILCDAKNKLIRKNK